MNLIVLSEGMARARHSVYPSVRQMLGRLVSVVLLWSALNAAFWFVADFGSFAPASDGPFIERAFFTAVTASGPFAGVIAYYFDGDAEALVFTAISLGITLGLVSVGLIWRGSLMARLSAYLGVCLWFFFGFCVAGIRIT